MYSSVVLFALLGVALASPQFFQHRPTATIVHRVHQQDEAGQFTSSFTSSDGSTFQEVGKLKPTLDGRDHVIVKEGSFQYTSPEGIPVHITYTADEYGFHPSGNVLPVAPAVLPPTF